MINANPFNNKIGVALGIEFYDENLGVIGMTGASQDASTLYVTSDGGVTFTQMEFPMEEVTELPDIADIEGALDEENGDGDLLYSQQISIDLTKAEPEK